MTDEQLTDAWEAGTVFDDGVSHGRHVRIAWVLHRRYGAEEARKRLLEGTERSCEAHGCPEKFDAALTARWARAIAEAIAHDGPGPSAAAFLEFHPELGRSGLLGRPHAHCNA
jgi:hypothetical protein